VTALCVSKRINFFSKAGLLPVGSGSPSFRFYLFVKGCEKIFVCASKSITASIRFILHRAVEETGHHLPIIMPFSFCSLQ